MKFKILPKVSSFADVHGVEHLPGEVVDLPPSYLGESWLEPIEQPKKVEVPAPKIVTQEETPREEEAGPFGKQRKKSRY